MFARYFTDLPQDDWRQTVPALCGQERAANVVTTVNGSENASCTTYPGPRVGSMTWFILLTRSSRRTRYRRTTWLASMSARFEAITLREGPVGQQLANMGYRLAPIPGVHEANIEPRGSAQIEPPNPNSEEWSTLRLGPPLRWSHHRVSSAGDERFRRLTGERSARTSWVVKQQFARERQEALSPI